MPMAISGSPSSPLKGEMLLPADSLAAIYYARWTCGRFRTWLAARSTSPRAMPLLLLIEGTDRVETDHSPDCCIRPRYGEMDTMRKRICSGGLAKGCGTAEFTKIGLNR